MTIESVGMNEWEMRGKLSTKQVKCRQLQKKQKKVQENQRLYQLGCGPR